MDTDIHHIKQLEKLSTLQNSHRTKEPIESSFYNPETHNETLLRLESELIGSILLKPSLLPTISFLLTSDSFQSNSNSILFDSLISIYSNQQTISTVSLVKHLQSINRLSTIGGLDYINKLTEYIPSTDEALAEEKAKYILEQSKIRKASKLSDRFKTTNNVSELIELTREIETTLNHQPNSDIPEISEGLEYAWKEFNELRDNPDKKPNIPTGFKDLDDLIGGLIPGRIYLIGARPSVGKTSLGIRIARNVSITRPTIFFSLEMPKKEIIDRLIAQESGVSHRLFTTGETPEDQLEELVNSFNRLTTYKLLIDESAPQSLNSITIKANRIKEKYKDLGLIVIDYIQLVKSERKNLDSVEEIKEASRGFKILAKKLNCPIILLAQLNRESVKPSNRNPTAEDLEPQLHHLKGSGDLEQDCDVCILLDRPELRSPHIKDLEGKALAYIRKNRHGDIGTIPMNYNKICGRFESLL